jgi:hypothetical protein
MHNNKTSCGWFYCYDVAAKVFIRASLAKSLRVLAVLATG